ncbi:dihydrofolate reductase family protein [Actinomadura napierensis]|uniref:Dihydrofolate reductase family protein n=1 Tax=Actinomadura napierensis TaxID=267854 RepID=A0ABN2ZQ07_9ACTN
MGKLTVVEHVTLDGVMQAPARADEDERDGFAHGGWAVPGNDEVMGSEMGKRLGGGGAILLGRRTYEDFRRVWPGREEPYADVLERTRKYVVSRTLREPLPWANSVLVDDVGAVAGIKQREEGLTVHGSGELVRSLARLGLVDEYLLMTHPLLLGTGRRLFEGISENLRLVDSVTTTTGVVIGTYGKGEDT